MPRMARRGDRSRRYHDRIARRYDAMYDDPYWAFHDELTWRTIRPHLPVDAHARCADLGCGTGKWGQRLLKSGYPVAFVDSSGAMVEQTRQKLEAAGRGIERATLLQADIVDLSALPACAFALVLAMGDPLSICSDAAEAARQMARLLAPGGVAIATADSLLAGLEHYARGGDLDGLERFVRSGRTHWLTDDPDERFELTAFTPGQLRRLFEEAGFEVLELIGKPVLPVREHPALLDAPAAAERLLELEKRLRRDPAAAARSAHLQITARRRPEATP